MKLTHVRFGTVVTEPGRKNYVGATKHSNNTGELTALIEAIRRCATRREGIAREIIHSDSLYAINMASGKWTPRKRQNELIICALREEWRRLTKLRGGEVTLKHVRSHVKIPGNELADWLAGRGIAEIMKAETEELEIATRWMRVWVTDARRQADEAADLYGGSRSLSAAGGGRGVVNTLSPHAACNRRDPVIGVLGHRGGPEIGTLGDVRGIG